MVKDIADFLAELAPFEWQMSFDNAGFLIGDPSHDVKKMLCAMDITADVIEEAKEIGADLIVSHHPIMFDPIKHVRDDDLIGHKIAELIRNNIAAICMHTNLDLAPGGVNDKLAEAAGLHDTFIISPDGKDKYGREYGLGRVGNLEKETDFFEYLKMIKESLGSNGLRYVGGRPVYKVAVYGGSCNDYLMEVYNAGCDTWVTADVKYETFLDAKELGLNVIDAGHYPTENVVIKPLAEMLAKKFPEISVKVSDVHIQTEKYY